MKKIFSLIIGIVLMISLISLVSAGIETLPPVKQGDCINLPQIYANSTYQNITYILIQNSNLSLSKYNINAIMTKDGSFFNYTFCNTTLLGHYIVNGIGDYDGIDSAWVYDFFVNGSGQTISPAEINLIIIGLVTLVLMAIFFFALALIFKHPGTKIFLMAMSCLTLIVLIGMVTANASLYLTQFTGIVDMYNRYYILLTVLGIVAGLGIVLWLIYYATTLFSKVRGRNVEDD
jgi:hypothetical protein